MNEYVDLQFIGVQFLLGFASLLCVPFVLNGLGILRGKFGSASQQQMATRVMRILNIAWPAYLLLLLKNDNGVTLLHYILFLACCRRSVSFPL